MPIYEYACSKTGCERQDKVVEISVALNKADALPYCPGCFQQMEKLISKSSFVLKGARWARDGYGNKR